MCWNWLRTGGLIATLAVAVTASSAAAAVVTCQVEATDAFQAAQDADFVFNVVQQDATECELVESTIIVAAPEAKDATCRVQLFAGKAAANGWRLVKLNYSASDNTVVDVSKLQPGWLFAIMAPRAQTSRVSVDSIIVKGPRCRDWRQAFATDE